MSKESAMAVATGSPIPASIETPVNSVASHSSEAPQQLQSTPFSQLANKEAEIVKARDEVKRERELINSEKQKIQAIQKQYDEYQTTKAKDPMAALKMLGFSETDIINYLANQTPEELSPEQKAAQAAEAAFDAKAKAFEENQNKKIQEQQKQADTQLIQSYRNDVAKTIAANPDEFEYCNYYGKVAQDLIYETVLAVVAESKGTEVVSAKEASQMVEQYYEDMDKEMNKLKKRGAVAAPTESQPVSTERTRTVTPGYPNEPQPKPTITRTRTLSGVSPSMASARQAMNETKDQKRERLMNILRGGR